MADTSELKRQYRISFMTFLATGVAASVSTGYIYFTTRSLLFLLQFLLALSGLVIHGIYLWISRTLYINNSRELAHYHGKLESYASLIGLFIVYANLLVLCGLSLFRIIFPSDIAELTLFAKLSTLFCIVYNLLLIFKCRMSVKKTGNIVMRSQLIEACKNLFSWVLCALTGIVATHFPESEASAYVEPVFCIMLAVVVGFFYFGIFKQCSLDLLDRTGRPILEEQIRNYLAEFPEVTAVSFRTCSQRVVVDVTLALPPDAEWQSARERARDISSHITSLSPECHIHVKIDFE